MAKSSTAKANKDRMSMIQKEAKAIWASGKVKKYSDAVKQGAAKLKKEGKL